jgi:uncharacterized membrane protein (DUF4010 family)
MEFSEILSRFAVALGVGLLFGLERGWRSRDEQPGQRTAGIRTFAITGLLGGSAGALANAVGGAGAGLVLGLCFAAYAAAITLFVREENRAEKVFSATTAVAGMLTFALGAYALIGEVRVASAAAVAATAILASRELLHGLVARITWPELRAAFVLLAMTFIALPLLPDHDVGPFGGINPRELWLIAIVLAAVSFVGYVAVKAVGATRGVLLAAAAGGMASSTAVMMNNASHAAAGEGSPRVLAAGAMLATAISILRTIGVVGVLNRDVLSAIAVPLAAAAVAAVTSAVLLAFRNKGSADDSVRLRNPFDLKVVLGFAALLAVMEVLARVVAEQFGGAGAVVGALVAGIADVDAVTVSMTRLAPATLSAQQAAIAVLVAVASNTLGKLAIGVTIGRGWFAAAILAASAAALIAGAVGWMLAAWLVPPV